MINILFTGIAIIHPTKRVGRVYFRGSDASGRKEEVALNARSEVVIRSIGKVVLMSVEGT